MFRKTFFRDTSIFSLLAIVLTASTSIVSAGQVVPEEGWEDDYNRIASPDAVPGGKIATWLGPYPASFNYYTDYQTQSVAVFEHIYLRLMDPDPITLEFTPVIAKKFEIGDDDRTFTIYLDEKAVWSDGIPITSADIKYTYEMIMDPENLIGPAKVDMQRFDPPVIIDERTIQITAKESHWRNLVTLAYFIPLPKHAFEKMKFNDIDFEFPVVSGAYKISNIKEGSTMLLKRREDWWLWESKRFEGVYNFETIEFRFYADRELVYEEFKKGIVDLYPVYTSHLWNNEAKGPTFTKNWVVKQQVYNQEPIAFQGFAINMREEKYKDVRVRKALAYLLDRERMNETLMYNAYFLLNSYYTDLYRGTGYDNQNTVFDFDIEKARALLNEAGWKANPATGKLEKNGEAFVINFLSRDSSTSKFLVIYQEALKDVGIDMNIILKDWAAWTKDLDEFNFEMVWAAYGSTPFRDPESMWSSKEADRKASQNVTGFRDERMDKLVEGFKELYSPEERNIQLRAADKIIAEQVPYILLWTRDNKWLLYWNRFGTPDTVLDKYSDEQAAYKYWWVDPDFEAELELAKKNDEALPARPSVVRFDEEFSEN